MTSEHIDELLIFFIRGELSAQARRRVSDHLIDCDFCQSEYRQTQKLVEMMTCVPQIDPKPLFAKNIVARAEEMVLAETKADLIMEEALEDLQVSRPSSLPWVLVGILLIAFGGVLYWKVPVFREGEPPVDFLVPSLSYQPQNFNEPFPQIAKSPSSAGDRGDQFNISHETLPETLAEEIVEDLILEYEVTEFGLVESRDFFIAESTPEKDIIPIPDQEEIRNSKFHFPEKSNLNLPEEDLAALKLPSLSSEPIENLQTLSPESHWINNLIAENGQVGQGDFFSVAFDSLLVGRVGMDLPHLVKKKNLERVFAFLDELSLENGVSRNNYYHAQFTYHLAGLVSLGRYELMGQLKRACRHLVTLQNQDGGWGFFGKPQKSPSNSLVSGWAALALVDAKQVGAGAFTRPIEKARNFFHRLTDPRRAECGFFLRGDHREPHLSSVFATLIRLTHIPQKKIPQTIDQTVEWIKSGMTIQRLNADRWTDYDFLLMSRRFLEEVKSPKTFSEFMGTLEAHPDGLSSNSRWEIFSPVGSRLLKELIFKE